VGILPTKEELNLDGVEITPEDLDKILSIDAERWRREMAHREQHLAQFDGLPNEIWAAHRRIAAVLEQGAD
jgi:phosphoenolpyruvate carboxykinase (GTP)